MPEEQAKHECVIITPRYERTTLNDYWEHTHDVENTYRLVESMLKNTGTSATAIRMTEETRY
jgi:hypothetical protein